MATFEKEITFLSKVFNADPAVNEFEEKEVTKTATFKELDRRDPKQAELHGMILSIFVPSMDFDKEEEDEFDIEEKKKTVTTKALYDITVSFVRLMLVPDKEKEKFTVQDKKELLLDNGAIYFLGYKLLSEKIMPFFLKLMPGFKK